MYVVVYSLDLIFTVRLNYASRHMEILNISIHSQSAYWASLPCLLSPSTSLRQRRYLHITGHHRGIRSCTVSISEIRERNMSWPLRHWSHGRIRLLSDQYCFVRMRYYLRWYCRSIIRAVVCPWVCIFTRAHGYRTITTDVDSARPIVPSDSVKPINVLGRVMSWLEAAMLSSLIVKRGLLATGTVSPQQSLPVVWLFVHKLF